MKNFYSDRLVPNCNTEHVTSINLNKFSHLT